MAHKGKGLTAAKAEQILSDKTVRGHSITPKQQRYFGWVAGGGKPARTGRRAKRAY